MSAANNVTSISTSTSSSSPSSARTTSLGGQIKRPPARLKEPTIGHLLIGARRAAQTSGRMLEKGCLGQLFPADALRRPAAQ